MRTVDLIQLLNPVEIIGDLPSELEGKLCQDSRLVEPGDIFVAVRGYKNDGHQFIPQAAKKGASIIVCEKPFSKITHSCLLVVKNSRKILGPLAQLMAGNPFKSLNIVGITGTNGKTTVATLVWQILTHNGYKASLLGTVEKRINDQVLASRLTTSDPVELASDMKKMVQSGSQYLIMEVSSHAIEQHRVTGIPFKVAAFTNLTLDHLDYHKSFEEYASAKKMLFNHLDSQSWAITNVDDPKGEWMTDSTPAKVLTFGFMDKGLINATIVASGYNGMTLRVDGTEFETPLAGDFNAYNVVQSLLICTALGIDGSDIMNVLKRCTGAPGRLEKVNPDDKIKNTPTVFVDYAHTPDALENVSRTLKKLKSNRDKLIIIFGCGGDRDKSKRPEMARIAEIYANDVIVTSDNPRTEDPKMIIQDIMAGFKKPENVTVIESRKKAIEKAILDSGSRAMILIAGKGHETYQEINGKRTHFDDREIARDTLKKITETSKKKRSSDVI